jgi:hypothetical protein
MTGDTLNYIGHNQWDGLNFSNFCNNALAGNYDKIILFCQNEWEWHQQPDAFLFEKLLSLCKNRNKPLYVISGTSSLYYPVQVDNTEVFWWSTYWLNKTYGTLMVANQGKKLSIDPYEKLEYKYHFISMNHNAHKHRCLLVDLLAKHNLLDGNAVSMHKLPHPALYTWRYFDGNPKILEPEFTHDKNYHRIIPQYYESFAQLVSESSGNTIFLSEKTATPLFLGKPFLVATQFHYHKFLKSLGFELYEEIFDYSFDDEPEEEIRYEMLLENFKKIASIPKQDLHLYQSKIADKLEFNKKHAKAIVNDKSLYPKIAIEAIEWYKATGNILDKHLIDDYENLEMYKDSEI